MDIHMPELTGWEVATMIRKKYPQTGGLHLVAVSGSATDAQAHMKSRKAGFDAHVTKPVEIELIQSIIKQLALRC
jgi:CheY-like chemotaxis protein